jgi:hypothetical protein
MEIVFYLKKDRTHMFKLSLLSLCLSCFTLFASDVDLSLYEASLYSQNGEDGVLAKIFGLIPPSSRYCVEIGASDGITKSNTYLLRLQGWHCLLLDRAHEISEYRLHKAFITGENINQIFETYGVPLGLDLLSIDVRYNNFYLWNALDSKYRPAVVVIPYNAGYLAKEDLIVKYHPYYCGDGTDYFGASISALYKLGKSKGYSLVYADQTGSNLFFIRDDLLEEFQVSFQNTNNVQALYRPSSHEMPKYQGKHPRFISSDHVIKKG